MGVLVATTLTVHSTYVLVYRTIGARGPGVLEADHRMVRIEDVAGVGRVYQLGAPIVFVTVGVVDGDRGVQLLVGELLELGEKLAVSHTQTSSDSMSWDTASRQRFTASW